VEASSLATALEAALASIALTASDSALASELASTFQKAILAYDGGVGQDRLSWLEFLNFLKSIYDVRVKLAGEWTSLWRIFGKVKGLLSFLWKIWWETQGDADFLWNVLRRLLDVRDIDTFDRTPSEGDEVDVDRWS